MNAKRALGRSFLRAIMSLSIKKQKNESLKKEYYKVRELFHVKGIALIRLPL